MRIGFFDVISQRYVRIIFLIEIAEKFLRSHSARKEKQTILLGIDFVALLIFFPKHVSVKDASMPTPNCNFVEYPAPDHKILICFISNAGFDNIN